MTPAELAVAATEGLAGCGRITLIRKRGTKPPPGFPRGELLCENAGGDHAYSYDALRVLAWLKANGLVQIEATAGRPEVPK